MKKIKLFDQSIDKKELVAVKKTLESHFWASGSSVGNVAMFENSLRKYIKTKYLGLVLSKLIKLINLTFLYYLYFA